MKKLLIAILLLVSLCPAQQQDPRLTAALHDLANKKPLPGLPDLKRPVYVLPGGIVCNTSGGLLNPARTRMFAIGECRGTDHRVRVKLLPPVDSREYLRDHMLGIVEFLWTTGEPGDGNVYTAWVAIKDVGN